MSHKTNKMNGMFPKLLRRHGFVREKGQPIFVRHTVGLGGIYAEILHSRSVKLTVRDQKTSMIYTSASVLEKVIGQLNIVDVIETARWKRRIASFTTKH